MTSAKLTTRKTSYKQKILHLDTNFRDKNIETGPMTNAEHGAAAMAIEISVVFILFRIYIKYGAIDLNI